MIARLLAAVLALGSLAAAAAAQDPAPPAPPPTEEPKKEDEKTGEEPAKPPRETEAEEVEVVGTGFARPRGVTTNPISIVEGTWFEKRGVSSVAEGLRQVPGAFVSQAGTPGAATSLFLRGTGSNQALVLQDGMPLNDPTLGNQFNFFDLDALNLDRVEVLRGSYGALYGNSAVGGVVNLVSRRGEGPGAFQFGAEFGSFQSHRETFSGSGGDEDSDWSFGASSTGTDGPEDREAFRSRSLSALVGARFAGDGRFEATLRFLDSTAQDPFDFPFGGPIPEDSNIQRERELAAVGVGLEKPLAPWLRGRLRASVTDADSMFRNGDDAGGAVPEFTSTNEATTTFFSGSFLAASAPGPDGRSLISAVFGGDYRIDEIVGFSESPFGSGLDSDATSWNGGAYFLGTVEKGPATFTYGGRVDDHSGFGTEVSPQAGMRLDNKTTRSSLRANYGEGFRAPTSSEFTDPFVGNPDLQPETSKSFDIGVDQEIGSGVKAEVTWFQMRTTDLIAFDFATNLLQNINDARCEGAEIGLAVEARKDLRFRASYTNQRPRDDDTGERLPNRADQFGSAGVEWTPGDFLVNADVYWQGTVFDPGQAGPDQDARDHPGRRTVVGAAAVWKASKRVSVMARVENLTDAKYVETPLSPLGAPRSFFLGVTFEF
jgi:vitamin B12 transporter